MTKKKKHLFLYILFWGMAILGLGMLLIILQSFETLGSLLNRVSSDDRMESFTLERFQLLKVVLGTTGISFAILARLVLTQWEKMQAHLDRFFTWVGEFNRQVRQDAWAFFTDMRNGFVHRSRLDTLILVGLTLAGLVMRLYELKIPLIADEAYTYNAFASGSLWVTVSDYHLPNNHVLLSIMINILTHLFGNQVWLIRLPTMIAGVLMIPAGYILGERLYGRNAAILSAALIAVFPILVMYSVWARGYGILSLITMLILILGDYVRKNKNRFAWFLLIVFSAVGFYTIPIMLFPFGALYIWLFLSCVSGDTDPYRSRPDFLKCWLVSGFATALLTLLLYIPIIIFDYDRFFHNQFVAPVGWDLLPSALWGGIRSTWLEWTSSISNWFIAPGIIGLVAGLILHKKISRQKIPLQFAFLFWIVIVLVLSRQDVKARMWLFLAAPLLIWSAGGIVGLLEMASITFRRNDYLARIVVSMVVLSVFLFSLFTIPKIPERWNQKGSIESTVMYLKDHLREGDLVNASTNSLSVIRYYFDIYGVPLDYVRRSGPFQRAFLAVSRETDTLESLSPVDGSKRPLIDLNTARIILDLDGLTVYECYPAP